MKTPVVVKLVQVVNNDTKFLQLLLLSSLLTIKQYGGRHQERCLAKKNDLLSKKCWLPAVPVRAKDLDFALEILHRVGMI